MAFTYLALGDSYTIGEQVLLTESFPYQAVQQLRKKNIDVAAPEIIAKTGWTSWELLHAVQAWKFQPSYSFVSLLMGVNNQYRGAGLEQFDNDFPQLVTTAIELAGNHAAQVFVFSIPDWGVTPFAASRDGEVIHEEINIYNARVTKYAEAKGCNYIDITFSQRRDGNKPAFLASDGLHPSGKEYAKWATTLAEKIRAFTG
ncbi:MAG: SGNH/GDSL hydrolase family protein [Ferruginibacter sp.]